MSEAKKVVVVLGATGLQGGSVVTSLLNDGGYTVRALTRSPENERAKALAARGVDIVKVAGGTFPLLPFFFSVLILVCLFVCFCLLVWIFLANELNELKAAFEGADAVFAATVSNYSPDDTSAGEYNQIVAIAEAAKATGSFLVFRYGAFLFFHFFFFPLVLLFIF